MEKLTADMGFELSGWAGRPTSQLKDEQEMELAAEASDDVVEEEGDSEDLNESLTELENENNSLKVQLDKYKQAVEEIKENLYEVNLSNARLLYTNRVLRNTSLKERLKDKIVEAISGAGSVAEAKTIFETLQSAVEAKPKHSPQSLSEAIGHKASVIRATRKESAQPTDTFSDRMRRLAGIKS
jgi:predicted nuclease with TOPRIM domain